MGLSVISQRASGVSTNSGASSTGTSSALPGDFATLLSGQSLSALMSQGSDPSLASKALADDAGTRDLLTSDTAADAGISQLDPAALIAMLGTAQNQPAARSEAPSIELNSDTLSAASKGQLLAGNIPTESTPKDLLILDKALAAQRAGLGVSGTEAKLSGDPAPATKPLLDTANIAAGSEPGMGHVPAFSDAIATSLHQRGVAPGGQSNMSSVAAHLHNPAWSQQFSEKVVWMANQEIQSAQININPPQLGPVQITLSLSGDQATAVFASPHAEVRQAIESSLPQLKEMLASAGISLGDTNVGANLAQQNQNTPFPTPNRTQATLENAILPANDNAPGAGVATPLQQGRGLVDLFA